MWTIDSEEEARECRYLGLTMSEATYTEERGISLVRAWCGIVATVLIEATQLKFSWRYEATE